MTEDNFFEGVFKDDQYLNTDGASAREGALVEYAEVTDDTIYLIQEIQKKYENSKRLNQERALIEEDNNTIYFILIGVAFFVGTKL
tara:strand:- start:2518 stop:2775 length:258 start_codon:yes stop_codon:yes gene_type:complete